MFELHIESNIITLKSGSVEWVRCGGGWYHGAERTDKLTESHLDAQMEKFSEMIKGGSKK